MPTDNKPLLSVEGTWWLPAHPDDRLHGTAEFDGTAVRLRVAGSFRALNFEAARDAEVLVGESEHGDKGYSLHRCFLESEGPGKKSLVQGEYLFDGASFGALEEPLWGSAYLQVQDLDRWFQSFPFHVEGLGENDGEVLLRRNPKKYVSIAVHDCRVSLSDVVTGFSFGFRQAQYEATAEFAFAYPAPVSFLKIAADCYRLQLLVSLLANRVMPQRRLVLCRPGEEVIPVRVYYSSPYRWLAPDPSAEPEHDNEVASYEAIKEEFPTVLAHWWSRFEGIQVPMQLLMVTLGSPTMEANLLTVAQALEAYHRGSSPGTYLSPEEYAPVRDAMISAIPPGIPPGLRDSLKSRVRFGNEHSLRTRVRSMLASLDEGFRSKLCPDADTFVDRLVRTRNALTHGLTSSDEDRVWQGAEIAYGTARARWLMLACVLQDLGVPPPRILAIASRNAYFQFLATARGGEQR